MRYMKALLGSFIVLSATGAWSSAFGGDDTAKQIQMLNSQLQVQLQQIQETQQKQIQKLNEQLQAQLKEVQTNLEAEIQDSHKKNEAKMKAIQDNLQAEIKKLRETVLTGGALSEAEPKKADAKAPDSAKQMPKSTQGASKTP